MPNLLRSEISRIADPGDLLPLAEAASGQPVFYWENPSRSFSIVAVGIAAEIHASGRRRFDDASDQAMELLSSIASRGEKSCGPMVVGGFAFGDEDPREREWREFPSARLWIPKLLWVRSPVGCWLTRVCEVGRETELDRLFSSTLAGSRSSRLDAAGSDLSMKDLANGKDRLQWSERVEAIRALIAKGAVRKVVIARRRALQARREVTAAPIIAAARKARPSCFSFWMSGGETAFLGSTPELLARVAGGRISSDALAGSAPRGATVEEDRRLGQALLRCPKNSLEHGLVVSAVKSVLEAIASPLESPAGPELLRLPEAQHLYTPVSGQLSRPLTVLEVAGLLHPTPAVCGVPREAARSLIDRDEPGRGWYSGAVGWMTPSGEGELAVALRSALIDGCELSVWAGAGIVKGSEAESEFAETEAKMTALLRSFGGEHGEQAA